MQINGVTNIYDNGEFVTITTITGSTVHLPINSAHSITILDVENPSDNMLICVNIDLYQG